MSVAAAAPAFAASNPHVIRHDASDLWWDFTPPHDHAAGFWWGLTNDSPDRTTGVQVQIAFPLGDATQVELLPLDPGVWTDGWELSSPSVSTTGTFVFTHSGVAPGQSVWLDLVTAAFDGDPLAGQAVAYEVSVTILASSLTAPHAVSGPAVHVMVIPA